MCASFLLLALPDSLGESEQIIIELVKPRAGGFGEDRAVAGAAASEGSAAAGASCKPAVASLRARPVSLAPATERSGVTAEPVLEGPGEKGLPIAAAFGGVPAQVIRGPAQTLRPNPSLPHAER